MNYLKIKAIKGLFWITIENVSLQFIRFIIGIVLARLLSAEEYGIIGLMTIFLSVSEVIIGGGFSSALIQKENKKDIDFFTVYVFNMVSSIFIWIIFILLRFRIANYYNEPVLVQIIPIFSFSLVLNAFLSTQYTKIITELNFKANAKTTAFSVILGGGVGISLALLRYGVWALVFQSLMVKFMRIILLLHETKWFPKMRFSYTSFIKMFKFGINILFTDVINRVYQNIYGLIIGKYYSVTMLGYYQRANQFQNVISGNISSIIWKVMFPIISKNQKNDEYVVNVSSKFIKLALFITTPLLCGLFVLSKPFVIFVLTEKWLNINLYLKLLSLLGILFPVYFLVPLILEGIGKGKILLKLEISKKIILTILLVISCFFSIKILLIYQIIGYIICIFINQFFIKKEINFSFRNLFNIISMPYFLSTLMAVIVYFSSLLFSNNVVRLFVSAIVGVISYIFLLKIFKIDELNEILHIIKNKIRRK